MFYCPGEDCSKKNGCFHHMPLHRGLGGQVLQLLDMSTQATVTAGYDNNGVYHPMECKCWCGDKSENYPYYKPIETWEDKGNWENYNDSAHAEGWPCPPGSPILIKDENGEEKVIPFDPKTLKLSTKVLDWYYYRRF